MNTNLALTNPTYNVRRELGHQTTDCDLFGEDDIAEMVHMCIDYLKPGGYAYSFCPLAQDLSCLKAV